MNSATSTDFRPTRHDEIVTISPSTRYATLWRALPAGLGFTLLSLPIVILSCVLLWVGISLGVGLTILWIGLPILAGSLMLARGFGNLEILRLRAAGMSPIETPDWTTRGGPAGPLRRMLRLMVDSRYWLFALHGAVVNLAVGVATWSIALTWTVMSIGGPTYWFWSSFISDRTTEDFWLHAVILSALDPSFTPASTLAGLVAGESILNAVFGLIFLVTLPPVIRGLVVLHHRFARLMLSESPTVALRREVAASEASREAAILAEDSALRRLERDIHDGPQQSLLRIQYDLASAGRRLDGVDAETRALVDNALQLSKDTLLEMRELSRGLAPPLLQDRGLAVAVRSLAARSPLPVTTTFDLDASAKDLGDVERSAYFIVSELLANTAKHAEATHATVNLATTEGRGPGASGTQRSLVIEVTDDGIGGAAEIPGHGLAGLRDRIVGLRGTLQIVSPTGGPSVFTVSIPLAGTSARSPASTSRV